MLEESIHNSSLLRNKFINSARLFGLLGENSSMNSRLINFMRNSVVYEEAMRSIFFRYFDAGRTQQLLDSIRSGSTKLIIDKRKNPSKFAELGISRASGKGGGEAVGGFEPRAQMIAALRDRTLTKTLQLQCFSCGSTQFLHLAGAPDFPKCHRCKAGSLFIMSEKFQKPQTEKEYESGLIRNFGKRGLLPCPATASAHAQQIQSLAAFQRMMKPSGGRFLKPRGISRRIRNIGRYSLPLNGSKPVIRDTNR